MRLLITQLCLLIVSACCTDLLEQSEQWEVGRDLSVANALRKSLSVGWYGSIEIEDKKSEKSDTAEGSIESVKPPVIANEKARGNHRGVVKSVADVVNELINSENLSPVDYSSKFANFPQDAIAKQAEVIAGVQEIVNQKKEWKDKYNIELEKYFPGIGTDCLYLRDDQVMKVTEAEGTKKKTQSGKYIETLKMLERLQKKKMRKKKSELNKKKKELQKELKKELKKDPSSDVDELKKKNAELDNEIDEISEKQKGLPVQKENLETSLLKLRKSLAEVFNNVKKEGKNMEVDLTSSNQNIPKDTNLREMVRVLQGYQDIARERLWDKTKFKIAFGGEHFEFYLTRAPLGYYQIFYEMAPKGKEQSKTAKKMGYKSERSGTQYTDILNQIDKIEVKGDDKKTREKQVEIAKFMLEILENPNDKQPNFPDVIPDFEDASKANGDEEKKKILWRNEQKKSDIKKTVGDLLILTMVVEAASMPPKQLEHYLSKMANDQGFVLKTYEQIKEFMKLPGEVRENYESAGRTVGLNSWVEYILHKFIEDPQYKRLKDIFLSKDLFPAHIKQTKNEKGGTYQSKEEAAKNKDVQLSSTLEFGASDASVDPTPGKPVESSDSSLANEELKDDLTNKQNFDSPDETAMEVEENVNKAKKRKNSETDQGTLAKKIKNPTDIEPESEDDNTCVSKRQTCSFKERDVELDESSIEINNDVLTYKLYDAHDKDKTYKVKTKVDVQSLSSVSYGKG
eukprot:gene19563-21495_t